MFGSKIEPLSSSSLQKKFLPLAFHCCIQAAQGDKCVEVSTVKHWVQQFKQEVGEASLCDIARSGRSVTPTGKSHQQSIEEMIQENHLIKQKETALKLGISKERQATLSTFLDSKTFMLGGYQEN